MELEAFELVLLRRPADPPAYDSATLDRIQREHLMYHNSLRASGKVLTNGPVDDQADTSLRGLTFYRTGSLARSRALAEADLVLRAGHHAAPRPPHIRTISATADNGVRD
jgi:uncharacterized protein YciI